MDAFRRSNHSVTKLVVHLVFVTKYRKKVVAADGESDHFHILVEYPPTLPISELVQRLKGRASRELRVARPDLAKRYWKGVLWTPSYFAVSAGGAPLATIKQYVDSQRG